MADYQLTPYRVTVAPAGDPGSPRRMGQVSPKHEGISVLDAVTNAWVALSREADPRKRSDDNTRQLDVQSVTRVDHQVECGCLLGVSGINSNLSLEALEIPAVRRYSDAEWFDLRVLFAASPSARAGILIVESVGNFAIGKHVSDLLRNTIRANVDTGVIVKIDPMQEALTLGQSIADLQTQSVEFKTMHKSGDRARNAQGGKPTPFSKVVKIQRRGGLGPFANFKGKKASEIGAMYGFLDHGEITDETTVSANVVMVNGRSRKVNVEEGTPNSISFPIDRESLERRPTSEEFYKVAIAIVDEVKQGTALGSLTVVDPTGDPRVQSQDDLQVDWVVTDETPTN
ncbi:hypothetical protein ATN37_25785 [Rhodococcus sp. MH15]|uniref:hypothetical protein n=1 Tax=Rhodococcus sp. MH15 TaxID=1761014 RepID=UPI001C4F76ED|nr:hypothetical protein [Rhodococcus sp. MH15]MBW0294076.1 hypothetical protein [Rhodococcus sp. MH15]